MKGKLTLIGGIGGLILVIGTCFTIYFYFEARYAHAGDMQKAMEVIQKIETRLDSKIIEDKLSWTQQKIWTIEDRYCPDKSKPCDESGMPQTVIEEYRELKLERERLQNELKVLKGERAKAKATTK
jgi:hypothetical protein